MTDPLAALDDAAVIALTLWGEARGEGPEGRIAIANVLRNRANRSGASARVECLKPMQFSCWNAGTDANHTLLMDVAAGLSKGTAIGPLLRECFWIARGLLAGEFVDNTRGSTHYLTTALLASHPPSWATGQRVLAQIGNHVFLRVA